MVTTCCSEFVKDMNLERERIIMIYAISDIHGCLDAFEKRLAQINGDLEKDGNRLVLLGDYIDRGPDSYRVLKRVYSLQKQYGDEKIIALKGNHEVWFEDFLAGRGCDWLAEDDNYNTSGTFLTEEQRAEQDKILSRKDKIDYFIRTIKSNHREQLLWMKKMHYYYETPTQIFVHAGVDEEISEEEMAYCTLGTPEYVMTGKFPPTIGKFYKDIIAGHVAARTAADYAGHSEDREVQGIFYDGYSHYYIDGSVEYTGNLLCLAYDEEQGKYYELESDGRLTELRNKK